MERRDFDLPGLDGPRDSWNQADADAVTQLGIFVKPSSRIQVQHRAAVRMARGIPTGRKRIHKKTGCILHECNRWQKEITASRHMRRASMCWRRNEQPFSLRRRTALGFGELAAAADAS